MLSSGNGNLTPEQQEIRQLREGIKRLKMEKEILKKATVFFAKRNQVKYDFITQHKKTWPVNPMCQVLGVHRHDYYSFKRREAVHQPDPEKQEMLEWLADIAKASGFTYGVRQMKNALNVLGYPVGKQRTRSLMKEAGIRAKQRKKYKVTTNSDHQQPIFEKRIES